MEKLSLKKYGWKCVLGSEIVYFIKFYVQMVDLL